MSNHNDVEHKRTGRDNTWSQTNKEDRFEYYVCDRRLTISNKIKNLFESERGSFNEVEQEITLLEAFSFMPIDEIFRNYKTEEIEKKIEETILEISEDMR